MANTSTKQILTDEEKTASSHILKVCGSQYKAAGAYLSFMRGVELRLKLEGYTPPPQDKK